MAQINVAERDSQSLFAVVAHSRQPKGAKLSCLAKQKLNHTHSPTYIHPLIFQARMIDNMEVALYLLIFFFTMHRFGLYKSAVAPRLATNHSEDHNHSCSQLGRWLADWPVSGMSSYIPAYS